MNTKTLCPLTLVIAVASQGLIATHVAKADPIMDSFVRAFGEYDNAGSSVREENGNDPVVASFNRELEREPAPRAPVTGVGIDRDELYRRISPMLWTPEARYDREALASGNVRRGRGS